MTRPDKRRYWLAGDREPGQDLFFIEALDQRLWEAGDESNWDSCWFTGMPDAEVFEQLAPAKTINHIPGNNGLTVKSYLYETLAHARRRLAGSPAEARMDYFPRAFVMPEDYHALMREAAANPDKRWILKPKNLSRGRGIEVVGDVATVPLDDTFLVQEYLDRPHTMNGHKYVLRLYLLITSVVPLRAYLYHEGFAKLASEPYDPDDPENPFSNLTNPDINAENEAVEAPVVFVGVGEYRRWLHDQGHDDEVLFTRIHELMALTAIAVRDHMRKRLNAIEADTRGCYELMGVDCLIDADLKPWILECNLSPSLEVCAAPEDGGEFEERTKRQLVADMVGMLGLNASAEDLPAFDPAERIAHEAARELANAGGFRRILPSADGSDYLSWFPVPRFGDVVQAEVVTGHTVPPLRLAVGHAVEVIGEDVLALYGGDKDEVYLPNPTAAWIWLQATGGASAEEIAVELTSAHDAGSTDPWRLRADVWDALADWAAVGLLRPAEWDEVASPTAQPGGWAGVGGVTLGKRRIGLRYGCPAVAARLSTALAKDNSPNDYDDTLDVLDAPMGYAIARGPRLVADGIRLSQVAPAIARHLLRMAPVLGEVGLRAAAIAGGGGRHTLVVSHGSGGWDAPALLANAGETTSPPGAVVIAPDEKRRTYALPLPCRVDGEDAASVAAALAGRMSRHIHEWSNGAWGHMVAATAAAAALEIGAVVIPMREEGASAATLSPMSLPSALAAIIPLCVGADCAALTRDVAAQLAQWLEDLPIYALRHADPVAAAALLKDLAAQG